MPLIDEFTRECLAIRVARRIELPDVPNGIVTKVRTLKTEATVGGIPFARGLLTHLLRNRFYIGEVVYKNEILPGEQPPLSGESCSKQFKRNQTNNSQTTKPSG